jgi:hypothetical protein
MLNKGIEKNGEGGMGKAKFASRVVPTPARFE